MPGMERPAVVALLQAANPRRSLAEVTIYADLWLDYQAAQANIERFGALVVNPRTAAPEENPWLAIRSRSSAGMLKSKIKADELWATSAARSSDP